MTNKKRKSIKRWTKKEFLVATISLKQTVLRKHKTKINLWFLFHKQVTLLDIIDKWKISLDAKVFIIRRLDEELGYRYYNNALYYDAYWQDILDRIRFCL